MLRAFGIRTNVISLRGAKMQGPVGRGKFSQRSLESLLTSRKNGVCQLPCGSKEVNLFRQLLPGAVIGSCSLDVGRMASNEGPVRCQDWENVAEPRAE